MTKPNGVSNKNKVLLLTATCIVSTIIYIGGTQHEPYHIASELMDSKPLSKTSDDVKILKAYPDLRQSPMYTAVSSWLEDKANMEKQRPSLMDPVAMAKTQTKQLAITEAALKQREKRRAYDGAPPTVPHPVIQTGWPDCIICHKEGLKIRSHVAPQMSHRELTNCSQCHVPSTHQSAARLTPTLSNAVSSENDFHGQTAPLLGKRAWAIAPPVIPHKTLMRENCNSCHGVLGARAIRTPHPNRVNCQGCHVAEASKNQRKQTLREAF